MCPFFFEDRNERAVTATSGRYYTMLKDFLVPSLQELQCFNLRTWLPKWRHASNRVIEADQELFSKILIFLWDYSKSKIYRNNPIDIPTPTKGKYRDGDQS